VYSCWDVKLNTHLHLVPRSKLSGAEPLIPVFFFVARAGTVLLFLYTVCVVQWNSLFLSSCGHRPLIYTQIDTHFKVIRIKTINRIVTEITSYFVLNCRQGFLIGCIEFQYFLCMLYCIVRIASLGFVFLGCLCVFVRCLHVGRSDDCLLNKRHCIAEVAQHNDDESPSVRTSDLEREKFSPSRPCCPSYTCNT
jgi:hypothetical protein